MRSIVFFLSINVQRQILFWLFDSQQKGYNAEEHAPNVHKLNAELIRSSNQYCCRFLQTWAQHVQRFIKLKYKIKNPDISRLFCLLFHISFVSNVNFQFDLSSLCRGPRFVIYVLIAWFVITISIVCLRDDLITYNQSHGIAIFVSGYSFKTSEISRCYVYARSKSAAVTSMRGQNWYFIALAEKQFKNIKWPKLPDSASKLFHVSTAQARKEVTERTNCTERLEVNLWCRRIIVLIICSNLVSTRLATPAIARVQLSEIDWIN